jgi:protein phosphatase
MFLFSVTAASRVGCVRDNNEDMLLVGNMFVRDDKLEVVKELESSDRYLLALADGMGGHACGEVASSDVLHNLEFFYNDIPSGLSVENFNDSIYEWLGSICNIIDAKGHSAMQYRNMGTTLVALAYYEGDFYWLNCGDSRLYRFHDGQLTQLTTDHSLSNMMGQKVHSNVITNCIGGGCKTSYIDIVRCTSELQAGDAVLLCSDGLTDMLDDAIIERMLDEGKEAIDLCHAAEDAGGFDNVSAIVLRLK